MKDVPDDEMLRRSQEDHGRLAEDMTNLGVAALSAVMLDESLDYAKVLEQLQFVRKVKFNRSFDLISKHDIRRHFARLGIKTEYGSNP